MAEYLECGAGTEYDAVLAFFTPNGKKKGFVVMTFGPKNVPAFYTAMMRILQDEWIILFIIQSALSNQILLLQTFFVIAKQ